MKVSSLQAAGLILGPAVFVLMLLLPVPDGLPPDGKNTAGVALWMVVWWITEAIPIPATSLIPLIAFPLLSRVFPQIADATVAMAGGSSYRRCSPPGSGSMSWASFSSPC